MGLKKPRKPILGGYFAGEVESVGKDVSKFKIGDQIFGTTKLRFGAYGEYVCLPASYTLAPKPNNVSFEEAAAIPLGRAECTSYFEKRKYPERRKSFNKWCRRQHWYFWSADC